MADTNATAPAEAAEGSETSARDLEGGSYEVIRARLVTQGKDLGARAEQLNAARIAAFGGTEMTVIGQCRVRTENNCVPRDIVQIGGRLLFGYNVFIGLRTETAVEDVFSLQRWDTNEDGLDLTAVALGDGGPAFLVEPSFADQFRELYRFYKNARLLQFSRNETQFLAVFQIGADVGDIRVFRWALDAKGEPTYVDNRGERDFTFPPSHDFEWRATTREDRREGVHPHVSIRDKVFVETVGGDLTVKVENNTESGEGIYAEPVDEAMQTLDDASIEYAEIGPLVLIKVRPYREDAYRYLVFSTRTQRVVRIDAIGKACVSLPEDHGIIFPGGFFLQDGQHKVFDGDYAGFEFYKMLRSPNGEDVLYVFVERSKGIYALLPYNLIRREIQTPIRCNGFSLFDDGRLVVSRAVSEEPTKVHPMQVWQTPFVSVEYAARTPAGTGFLHKLGNADLVRGISDCLSVRRFIDEQTPSRQVYEDLIANVTRIVDAYHWLGHAETFALAPVLQDIRKTADLIVGEFEKVVALRKQAASALATATRTQQEIIGAIRPDSWTQVAEYMDALAKLRTQRGTLITLREQRYMDLAALQRLEDEVVQAFNQLSATTVRFLARDDALAPVTRQLDDLLARAGSAEKTNELAPHAEAVTKVSDGLAVLSEVAANLQVDDPTLRTRILEGISESFAHCNRVRAVVENRRRELLSHEGRAEFAAQFKLYGQAVQSAIALCDTPERCDEQQSRLMVQLEELEAKFSEFDEFIGELTRKREEVFEAFGQRKQLLVDERQRRVANLWQAAERIITGLSRRASSFSNADELNSFFAADGMVLKLRELGERISELGDTVKSEEVQSRLKSTRQDALRSLRDRLDLFEGGADLIKLGKHRFTINAQPLELTMVPHEGGMALGITGTDFVEPIVDPQFEATRPLWSQQLVSETDAVYRGEFLAASILAEAEGGVGGLSVAGLAEALRTDALLELVRRYAADRYQEGYERGVHDADAAAILGKLVTLHASAGLLRFSAPVRALALLHWSYGDDARRGRWHSRARSLLRLRSTFARAEAVDELAGEIAGSIRAWIDAAAAPFASTLAPLAAHYLVEELAADRPRFVLGADAAALRDGLMRRLEGANLRRGLEDDLQALAEDPISRYVVALAWLRGWLERSDDDDVKRRAPALAEAAAAIATGDAVEREVSAGLVSAEVTDLLGQHPRIVSRRLELRIDEFSERTDAFRRERVPAYLRYREQRQQLVDRERSRLRLEELRPKVLTSFVRNRLIDEVYLPLIGDNLAKQLGAAGEGKRTDLMGMLLLISPPGYGKTTLMEYVASRLGLAFVKVNGPALGHGVTSIDPADAPNATARQEVEKINFGLEMGNNVMLYLDDIQHTNPELLQKFISLCDAQRRIEGVWKGRTRTYDLRGKKFCVVMAGNPYTESGEKFQIPDMLANRADTYNLGDILHGKDELFALSYIENAVTSNRVLAPLATREPADLHRLVRLAHGEEVPASEFAGAYSAVEIAEIVAVLQRLFKVQKVLLDVNRQYIASASMDDRFRTEPPFKLQGSYRNMNKLAEKVVAAMNDDEMERLVDDHYRSESQTLTIGAEQNLLKLAELRGRMSEVERARWDAIKLEFQRLKMVGGSDEDPVARVTAGLANLAQGLRSIETVLGTAAASAAQSAAAASQSAASAAANKLGDLDAHIYGVQQSIAAVAAAISKATAGGVPRPPTVDTPGRSQGRDDVLAGYLDRLDRSLQVLASPKLEVMVHNQPPPGIEELLAQQIAIIERTLVPLVRTTNQSMGNPTAVDLHVQELLRLMRAIDERLRFAVMGPAPQR
ncbi:MAG: DNA repair ATPase [Deltaproteobacteria bacterium]|nr:DNA repair ATPase [Deltaproteobacteria bacterium]